MAPYRRVSLMEREELLRGTLNSAYCSIDGFLLPPGKDWMRVVLAGFLLTPVRS